MRDVLARVVRSAALNESAQCISAITIETTTTIAEAQPNPLYAQLFDAQNVFSDLVGVRGAAIDLMHGAYRHVRTVTQLSWFTGRP